MSTSQVATLMQTLAQPTNSYPNVFRTYIARNIEQCWHQLNDEPVSLVDEVREQMLHTIDFALKMPDIWSQTRRLLLALAPKMEQAGYRDDWLPYLESGAANSQFAGDRVGEAELHLHMGAIAQFRSNFDCASEYFTTSAALFEQVGDSENQGKALNRAGGVARLQAKHAEAEQIVQQAFDLLDEGSAEAANSYAVWGGIAFDRGEWPAAQENFELSLEIWQQADDQRRIAFGLRNVGTVHNVQGNYDLAANYFMRALAILEEVSDPANEAIVTMNLGNVHLYQNQNDDALALYSIAAETFVDLEDTYYLAMTCTNRTIAYRQAGKWQRAEGECYASIEMWKRLENQRQLINLMDELGLIQAGQGQIEQAKTTFINALALLEAMENKTGYQRLHKILVAHLQELDSRPDGDQG